MCLDKVLRRLICNSMAQVRQVRVDYWDRVRWYRKVVYGPLVGRYAPWYHPCCNTYTTNAARETRKSHTAKISFTKIFKKAVESNNIARQVERFLENECDGQGLPTKNGFHGINERRLQNDELASNDRLSVDDSREEKDIKMENEEFKRFEDRTVSDLSKAFSEINRLNTELLRKEGTIKAMLADQLMLAKELCKTKNELSKVKLDFEKRLQKLEGKERTEEEEAEAQPKQNEEADLGKRSPQEHQERTRDNMMVNLILSSEITISERPCKRKPKVQNKEH